MSEEDLKLKQNLELYVERVQDPNPELQKAALESMRQEIRALTSSMTLLDRMPKRLSWLELGALEEAEKAKHYYKQRWSMTRLPPNIPVTDPKPHKAPKKVAVPSHLPEKLMKLDLQCFPDAELPSLHEPGKLRMLEKLYIKGGTKLTGFGKSVPEKPTECSVKVLRLKFLPRLKVEWRELRELYFPKLEFLDKYQSPQREELAKAIADARERQEAQLKDNPLLANPCTVQVAQHAWYTMIDPQSSLSLPIRDDY
ncbi:hypothetical protein YC2023_098103 [Brassica napus]